MGTVRGQPTDADMNRRMVWVLIVVLIGGRLVLLLTTIERLPAGRVDRTAIGNDVARYQQIASTIGAPYRDFQVEVPPVSLAAIELLEVPDLRHMATRLALAMFIAEMVITLILFRIWGRDAALLQLFIGLPLARFIYFRLDLLSVAFAVGSLAATVRGRRRLGGTLLAVGVLTKVWPLALVPILAARRAWRTLTWAAGGLAVGTAAWVIAWGWDGPIQVLTFRRAAGWEIGSSLGLLTRFVTGGPILRESGAWRVAGVPTWLGVLLVSIVLAGSSALVWVRVRKRGPGIEALGILTLVAALLVCAPIFAEQYVSWLVPWAAIAAASGARYVELPTFAVALVATVALLVPPALPSSVGPDAYLAFLVIRNVLVAGVAADGVRRLSHGEPAVERSVRNPAA